MKFDIEIPTSREGIFVPIPFTGPKGIIQTIQFAEKLGYNAVWGTDFINPALKMGIPDSKPPNWYELLITLAYAAAVTDHIRLGTGVTLLTYRDPVILAKQAATLDCFSNGRFIMGLGIGGFRDEFESIMPKYKMAHRGRMFDEKLEALQLLLSHNEGEVSYNGEYVEFNHVSLNPKPVQNPLPIYAPGRNPNALRRIAKLGLGYMIRAVQARERIEALRPVLDEFKRDISHIDLVAEAQVSLAKTHKAAVSRYKDSRVGYRNKAKEPGNIEKLVADNWIGTVEEVAEKIMQTKSEGISHFLALHIAGDTMGERLEQMQWFAEEVIPLVK